MDEPSYNETDLVASAQRGDKQAFCRLVSHHWQGVINVVYRMCGDAGLAEDAAQEAFVRAWLHLASYRPRSPLRNWLYRIALNAAHDELRREHETIDVDELPLASDDEGPREAVEREQQTLRVRSAVRALPAASRSVLVLREYEGLSYHEIADVLDIPLGTVMSRLNYARGRLRQTLAAELGAQ